MNDTQNLLKFNLIIFVKRLKKKNVEIEKKRFRVAENFDSSKIMRQFRQNVMNFDNIFDSNVK